MTATYTGKSAHQNFNTKLCPSSLSSPQHLFAEHHLNLGRPDNLVHIDALLRYLEVRFRALSLCSDFAIIVDSLLPSLLSSRQAQVLRNQCLYCHKTFEDRLKFKNHLRKKQHYRLNAADKDYDAFFIVYYGERPGCTGRGGPIFS